tara:strand:- start:1886 stop:2581 length:696 start_codon:yes stop_codon:yes gene_type:complete
MPITINGSGTISGVSVGGLPDGIVDTDMIAANAVTTAKSSGRHTYQKHTQVNLDTGSLTSATITGIPNNAVIIKLFFLRYSTEANTGHLMRLRFGAGSLDSGSNYSWGTFRTNSTANTDQSVALNSGDGNAGNFSYMSIIDTASSNASHIFNGVVTIERATDSGGADEGGWFTRGRFTDLRNDNEQVRRQYSHTGRWRNTGNINQIQIFNGGNQYDESARVVCCYQTGDYE